MKSCSKKCIVFVCMVAGLFMLLSPFSALAAVTCDPPSPLTIEVGETVTVTVSNLPIGNSLNGSAAGGNPDIATVSALSGATSFTVVGVGAGSTSFIIGCSTGETFYYFITVVGDDPPPPPPPLPSVTGSYIAQPSVRPAYEQATVGKCKEWVTIRSGPGTGFDALGKAYLGETIELIQWAEKETWCKVFYNGGNSLGWIHRKFIILAK